MEIPYNLVLIHGGNVRWIFHFNCIDSRNSEQCNNGLFICDNSGSCCIRRRLSNLKQRGCYIYANLVRGVNEKQNLERAKYFCYKCKSEITEISNDIFQCSNCIVKYDTTEYKFKRPYKHLSMTKTTAGNHENSNSSDNNEFFSF